MRKDSDIQKEVAEELGWEPLLRSEEIAVSVKDGVVTLAGIVDTYSKKVAAERAARNITGVKAIALDLQVKPHSIFQRTDSEIAHAVMDALKWNSAVREEKIKVKVEDGWVTLDGEAEWHYQRTAAKEAVEGLLGVKGVTNMIILKPKVTIGDVRQKISSALTRHAVLDAGKIQVETTQDKVTLTGKVRSLAEKRDAENAAWAVPGVKQVDNQLEVSYQDALVSF